MHGMPSPLLAQAKRHFSTSNVDLPVSYETSDSFRIFSVEARASEVQEATTSSSDSIVAIFLISLMRTFNLLTESAESASGTDGLAY